MLELRSPEQGAPAAAVEAALVRRRGLLPSSMAASVEARLPPRGGWGRARAPRLVWRLAVSGDLAQGVAGN
jgi:hypothetical protein